jgi:8-oxo-dGTP diphosphatase
VKEIIKAAGAVVLRGKGKSTEVLVIHRTMRNDWSLPKGKLDPFEYWSAAAVREVAEETGYSVRLSVPLTRIRYKVQDMQKEVRYWLAHQVSEEQSSLWQPNQEVDKVRWVKASKVNGLLSYKHDVETVRIALDQPRRTSPLVLLRHADAMSRKEFKESSPDTHDMLRSLSFEGISQTPYIAAALSAFGITNAFSSPAKRCVDTLVPSFITERELKLQELLWESESKTERKQLQQWIETIVTNPGSTVVCGHRPMLPELYRAIANTTQTKEFSRKLAPGHFVIFHRSVKKNNTIKENPRIILDTSS